MSVTTTGAASVPRVGDTRRRFGRTYVMLGAIVPALAALCAGWPAADRLYVIAGSAPGGQFLNHVSGGMRR